ncbi:F0F1 ATP synthase subunit B [Murimonas intestini]|uniref:F0F1 ATP synthase subunit B n=1 Tax=Murimonas intestini TaxID=1337051 RepID=UPI0011DDE9E0|nr:F0F1 ATP synthase subunit B [Murimonas intestini]
MERLFNLDPQLIHDTVLLAIAVLIMFTLLSYLLFNPVRDMLKKRQERIKADIDEAQKDKEDALRLKEDYDARIRNIEKEAEEILSDARKKALKNEAKILEEAKEEAARIIARANAQIELEKKKAADDMKKEIIAVASMMAAKAVTNSMSPEIQDALMEETLKEIGDQTWQS